MENKQIIEVLRQREEKMNQKIKLAGIVSEELENWGDKVINKRLATQIQNRLDKEYGVIPFTDEQASYERNKGKAGISKVYASYSKDSGWSGEVRYQLRVYSRELVEKLPRIQEDRENKYDETEIDINAQLCHDMEEIKRHFDFSGVDNNYQEIIDRLDEIKTMYKETVKTVRKYHEFIDSFGSNHYILNELLGEIQRIY